MGDYTNDAIYGYTGSGTLGADMLNPYAASGPEDFGAVIANGIRGAAQGAIGGMVAGAQASGQLQQAAIVRQQSNNTLLVLLLVGGVLYAMSKA
jgi:hypothetical protein